MRGSSHLVMTKLYALVLLGILGSAGCYTEYAVRPTHCVAVWVPGHYGPFGRWHPGHWRCR
jgi:hypothetical protein